MENRLKKFTPSVHIAVVMKLKHMYLVSHLQGQSYILIPTAVSPKFFLLRSHALGACGPQLQL